ncbi:MAG: hypothetical protein IPK26_22465 [Planctomycetes bacterium]|nr:hypothetical protein [Planctomycetota bacterium]
MTSHRDAGTAQALHQAFLPLAERMTQQRLGVVRSAMLAWATRRLPREALLAAVVAGVMWLLFPLPWWLWPLIVVLLAVLRVQAARPSRPVLVRPIDAALACDHAHGNHDRLATALELAAAPPAGAGMAEQFAAAAIADGLESLQRVDRQRADGDWRAVEPAWGRAFAAIAVLALFCWLLPARTPGGQPGTPAAGAGADPAPPAAGPARREVASIDSKPSAAVPHATQPPKTAANEPSPLRREPTQPAAAEPQAAVPAASGAGRAGSDTPGERSQSGAPKAAPSGTPGSGQPGGGQGASAAGAPEPTPQTPRPASKPKSRPRQPERPTRDQQAPASDSAGTPSGGSRGSGNTAPVGNKRQDLSRGQEREDEAEVDEEPIEDETDEQEQRGGVMPLKRQDQRPAARELSISGDGPPDQGRGGPTPPKKARGTASLVLGLRLPDQVRGQPNPGTAKTSLEQIPPQRQQAPLGDAAPAPAGRAGTPQSARPTATPVHTVLARYHARLRALDDKNPVGGDAADSPRR